MNRRFGTICVCCSCNNQGIPGCRVYLVDSYGRVVQETDTDNNGCACFLIYRPDQYKVCVLSDEHYLPCGDTSCCSIFATPCQSHCRTFTFRYCCNPLTGSLTVSTQDAYYPEYMLSEGEITLWRGLK